MSLIQIFIATYNRPSFVLNSVNSVLNQVHNSFEVIVSDNSTNDETEILFSHIEDNRLSYRRRRPSLPVIDHLNAILQDVTSDYFMIFHDDDVMLPNMIEELYNMIIQDENYIAVGANAFLNINGRTTNKRVFRNSNKNMILNSKDAIVKQYLTRYGIVPFPSYLYKRKVAQLLRLDQSKGGKHCDVAFIMDISNLGSVISLNKPLMVYTIHKGQDTQNHAFEQRIKLINYIARTSSFNRKNNLLTKYRVYNLYSELKEKLLKRETLIFSTRYFKIVNIIFRKLPFEYCIKILIISMYSLIRKQEIKVFV
jgi:glycosyltransferase involved in cell wall biosynthesis